MWMWKVEKPSDREAHNGEKERAGPHLRTLSKKHSLSTTNNSCTHHLNLPQKNQVKWYNAI